MRFEQLLRSTPAGLLASLAVVAVIARVEKRTVPRSGTAASVSSVSIQLDASASVSAFVSDSGAAFGVTRMQHGGRRRVNRSTAKGPESLRVKWKTVVGAPIEAQVVTSPDENVLYASTLGGELVAIARDDGAVKFRVPLGGRSYATPCVDDRGNVYSASDAKKLFAVRSSDGHVSWTLDLDDEGDTACALADDGTIVIAAGRTLLGVLPNGDVAWRFSARGKIFTAPAIDDGGRVFVGSQDHHVYAALRGQKQWAVDLGSDVDGSPAIDDDGAIVVGTDGGEVVRLEGNGNVAWTARVGGFVRGAISIARGGDVLAGVYGPRSRLVRLDGKTGAEKASFIVAGTGATEFGVHGGPLEDITGALFFGAQDDRVRRLAPGATTPSFTLETEGDVDAPVTLLSNGALIVASDDGAVYSLEP